MGYLCFITDVIDWEIMEVHEEKDENLSGDAKVDLFD